MKHHTFTGVFSLFYWFNQPIPNSRQKETYRSTLIDKIRYFYSFANNSRSRRYLMSEIMGWCQKKQLLTKFPCKFLIDYCGRSSLNNLFEDWRLIIVVNRKFTNKFFKKLLFFWLEPMISNIKSTMTTHSYKGFFKYSLKKLDTKFNEVSWWVFWVGDPNVFTTAFLLKIIIWTWNYSYGSFLV